MYATLRHLARATTSSAPVATARQEIRRKLRDSLQNQYGYTRTLPKAYMDAEKEIEPHQVYDNRFGAETVYKWFGERKSSRDEYAVTDFEPWESDARQENQRADAWRRRRLHADYPYKSKKYPAVEPLADVDWHLFVGDKVIVNVGPDSGKVGIVSKVVRERNRVFVENMHRRLIKRGGAELKAMGMKEQYVWEEQALDVANKEVSLFNPDTNAACDVEWMVVTDGQKSTLQRFAKDTETSIAIPDAALESYDFVLAKSYKETRKDTVAASVLKDTYSAELESAKRTMSFEESIMESNGIEDDRQWPKTYWY